MKLPDETAVTPSVYVVIRESRETIVAYFDWSMRERIFPIRGLSQGPGWYEGVYSAEDGERIRAWLAERKVGRLPSQEAGHYPDPEYPEDVLRRTGATQVRDDE